MAKDWRAELVRAAERAKVAEDELAQARKELRGTIAGASLVGEMSYTEIGRVLGISRQRVAEIVGEVR